MIYGNRSSKKNATFFKLLFIYFDRDDILIGTRNMEFCMKIGYEHSYKLCMKLLVSN